ncbi:efflux RND transporter periplasmic adaptor subunit [Aureispira anguillae]|uniref:Efflux RND transporter periplasmic adaptor subunit n=1 Tax=Aureispira anguillae TaxID=2864201 RepID=A0A915YH97_9BACT|nr:efflux RND transporter periplasmic adaptor subunit [Aureispira anguillae]BDS13160.1 efflux RND transporter periplasmic adaptor subunit [Aureispira anguillae]
MKSWIILLFVANLLLIIGCHSHDHEGHDHSGHDHSGHDHGASSSNAHEGHDHGSEENIITYTLWEGDTELFLEFTPFVVGNSNSIRAVLTDLNGFKPLDASLEIHIKGKSKITTTAQKKGIFEATLPFKKAGKYDLVFVLGIGSNKQSFVLNQIPVASNKQDAFHLDYPNQDEKGSITFQRDQSWKSNFAVEKVLKRPVGDIIHTSGIIQPSTTDLSSIVAKRDGIVTIRKKNLTSGTAVRAGELLFTITGKGIIEDDLAMNFLKAQSNFDRQKSNLDRKQKLLNDKIIGQKEYDLALNEYELAAAEFDNLKKLFNKGEKRHLATTPSTGFVSQLLVQEGQFVKAGQPLASILKTSRVQVKVDVSPRYRSLLPTVIDANFINPYNDKAYSMSTLEGKIISFGRMTSHAEGHYIPIYFEINNHPDLSPGAMVEVFLMTQPNQEQLAIPRSAIIEEMGSYVVFIQKSAESYEKQVIEIGADNGIITQVISGLELNDKVVTSGALQIKLASMAGTVDPHAGHNH